MTRQFDVVVTTIFEPSWLQGYLDNLRTHGHEAHVTIRIVIDRKTPPSVLQAATDACAQGFSVDCPTLDEQAAYLRKLGVDDSFIPWNSDNRRNIGFLRALESGADILISIDDDNYCQDGTDFIAEHALVGQQVNVARMKGADGGAWFNNCRLLQCQVADSIFPRGFPFRPRHNIHEIAQLGALDAEDTRRISINAGMWLGDPDVDAVSRLVQRPQVSSVTPGTVVLGQNTWCPINTQNTALDREAIAAYYYVRMGFPIEGLQIDRYGDILSGYFLQACAKAQGDAVCFGGPVTDHRRTPHNLFKDLYFELAGMVIIEDLVPWLQNLNLPRSSYAGAYAALADELDQQAARMKGFVWDQGGVKFLHDTASNMRQWLHLMQQLHGGSP